MWLPGSSWACLQRPGSAWLGKVLKRALTRQDGIKGGTGQQFLELSGESCGHLRAFWKSLLLFHTPIPPRHESTVGRHFVIANLKYLPSAALAYKAAQTPGAVIFKTLTSA